MSSGRIMPVSQLDLDGEISRDWIGSHKGERDDLINWSVAHGAELIYLPPSRLNRQVAKISGGRDAEIGGVSHSSPGLYKHSILNQGHLCPWQPLAVKDEGPGTIR